MKLLSFRMVLIAIVWPIWFLVRLETFLNVTITNSTNNTTIDFDAFTTRPKNTSKDIETTLIIAAVPYSANHIMALWTQLECVTDGIDRVLISAPDTLWSKEIIAQVIDRFTLLSKRMSFTLEASFYVNNRYDVGLWCDGIDHILARNTSTAVSQAIFLINDSAAVLRRYDELTNRTITATKTEKMNESNNHEEGSVKLISLNGDLSTPGRNKFFWVESVYRGLTPKGLAIFYKHSCSAKQRRACVGKRGIAAKDCIVDRFEHTLTRSYSPLDLSIMFPSFPPTEWEQSIRRWETRNGSFWRREQWLQGRKFFWYMYEVHDFPFRKLKWLEEPPPPVGQCLELLDGKPQFGDLPYPSETVFKAYRAEMIEAESLL